MASIQDLANLLNNMEVVDLSPLFYTNMPGWHTHPDVSIVEDARNFTQNGYFLQLLVMPEHCGSHVDAPAHAVQNLPDRTIDKVPVNALMGVAKKIDLSQENLAPGQLAPLSMVKAAIERAGVTIEKGDIVLFDFGWDKYLVDVEKKPPEERNYWGTNEPGLDEDVCRFLYETGIKAVGSDKSACDIADDNGVLKGGFGHAVYFLPNNIYIIEGLYGLSKLPSTFYFMALPLKIKGGSGSPIRPIALVPRQ